MLKKIFFVAALLVSTVSFAQFSDLDLAKGSAAKGAWSQIGQPFVATTIDGATIDLQAWIDSGYSVVIDYSACWCGPCWTLHQAGILEGFYNRFGPNGTNELRCLWVEIESTNTIDQIRGVSGAGGGQSGTTQGDWTFGGTFPIPIVDDASALNTCMSLFENAVPYVVYIEGSTGNYTSIYGEPDGISQGDTAICNSHMADLLALKPVVGGAPNVSVNLPERIIAETATQFSVVAHTISPVTNVEWSFEGGSPATATGMTASTTWEHGGTYTVSVTVSNENGSTTVTKTVQVIEFNYEWGNTMTYLDGEVDNHIGSRSGGQFTWGVVFPSKYLAGRNHVKSVDLYVYENSTYTIEVYSGTETAPQTMISSRTLPLQSEGWRTVNISGPCPIDASKALWVTITATGNYPMSSGPYNGDINGSYLKNGNTWMPLSEATSGQIEGSWAIRVTTGDDPNVGIAPVEDAQVAIYPNPATDKVSIHADNIVRVEVLDVTGRTVATTTQNEVNISNLDNGVYMFRVITANGTTLQKVVKK